MKSGCVQLRMLSISCTPVSLFCNLPRILGKQLVLKMAACPAASDWYKLNLVLVRHGESSNNTLYDQIREIHGNDCSPELMESEYNRLHLNDPVLSERGEKQAEKLGDYIGAGGWKSLVKNSDNWDIVSSPQLRALMTAKEVSRGFSNKNVTVLPFMHESDGCYESTDDGTTVGRSGLTAAEVESQFPDFKCAAGMEEGWYKRPHKETRSQYLTRVSSIIDWLWSSVPERSSDTEDKGLIIVAHSNLIGKLICTLVGGHGMLVLSNTGWAHVQLYATKPHITPACAEKQHIVTLPGGQKQIRMAVIMGVNNVSHLMSTPELIAGNEVFDDVHIQEYLTTEEVGEEDSR